MKNNPHNKKRKEETFIVRIHDTQNQTWQGTILWAEKQKQVGFRSALEMLKLIDSVIEEDSLQREDSEK